MDAMTVYALLNKKLRGVASGIQSVVFDVLTNSLVFTCTDGTVINVPVPSGLTTTERQEVLDVIDNIEVDPVDGTLTINGVKVKEDTVNGGYTLNGEKVLMTDDTMSDSDFDDELDNILGI